MAARRRSYGCHPICATARYQEGSGSRVSWNAGRSRSLPSHWPTRCTHGLGHDGARERYKEPRLLPWRHSRQRTETLTNWRGHDDVMQTRSFRGSGAPAWVSASLNACLRLGPDPRRALGPAATPTASTGRTRDRTRPMLQQRQKVLARAPSTRDLGCVKTQKIEKRRE